MKKVKVEDGRSGGAGHQGDLPWICEMPETTVSKHGFSPLPMFKGTGHCWWGLMGYIVIITI